MTAQRIVIKVGSSSLTDEDTRISVKKMDRLVTQIAQMHRETSGQIILVSSGAIAAGIGKLGWSHAHCTMPEKQAAAAVGQEALISLYERLFAREGISIAQILLTRSDVEDRRRFVNIRNTIKTLLRHGILPIVNENDTVAVDEIRFGDNDTLASLVALTAEADKLILLTDIDGLYTANPKENPEAQHISDVWDITGEMERAAGGSGSTVGTGGMKTKITAAKIAVRAGIDVVIASSHTDNVLRRVMQDERIGTMFHASSDRPAARKSWIAFGTRARGRIGIDDGAIRALKHHGSLLVPGITKVTGDFLEGSTVEVSDADDRVLGRGIVNFSARDLKRLLARRTAGESIHDVQEIIHRNDLMIFE
ncbi:glutamate 5-kinase [Alicyclobacillus dauci]|uniref:Glutamate 5-kinase n=1 Tax=Alicyclobacillus dauci TaxID=1475485 RepID=A0ABY6Z7P7_9BACL|nr:glutamate 5-kinase [Alicyclobacillus dauci]WAH38770.1 glutamate 5-kinase [Alicyclobacillus dauci]